MINAILRLSLFFCSAFMCAALLEAAVAPPEMYYLTDFKDGNATLVRYTINKPVKLDVVNVKLRDGVEINEMPIVWNYSNFKSSMLSSGHLCLIDLNKATEEEKILQTIASKCNVSPAIPKVEKKPIKPSVVKKPPEISRFQKIIDRIWANWEKLVGVGAIVLIVGFFAWIIRTVKAAVARKAVDLIIAGTPAAGKTALYKRLVDPDISKEEIDKLQASNSVVKGDIESIAAGKFTFFPRLKDIPGSAFGGLLDEFVNRRMFQGYRTANSVLLIVLAPAGLMSRTISSANHEYLTEQYGWSTLVQGIIQSEKLYRPDVIAIFLNKTDLYENSGSLDQVYSKMRNEFSRVIDAVEKSAASAKIPVVLASGSARFGIGTGDLIAKITRKLAQMSSK